MPASSVPASAGSDLDLVIMADEPVPLDVMAELREDLTESDVTVRVDVCQWRDLPDWLKQVIETQNEVVQEGGA